jgi:hypothetical protein
MLEQFCFDCHADGANKGNMSLDEFKDDGDMIAHKSQWLAVMKNVRAGVMPPPGKPRPTEEQQKQLADWIKYGAFGIDRSDPDPGRVTIHRLNRVEYRNTIAQILAALNIHARAFLPLLVANPANIATAAPSSTQDHALVGLALMVAGAGVLGLWLRFLASRT